MTQDITGRVKICCILVGASDLVAGLVLLTAPALALRLMQVDAPDDLFWLRWIGAFVISVGLATLYPLPLKPVRRRERLHAALEITALARLAIGSFTTVALIHDALDLAWISVPLTDFSFAAVQIYLLRHDFN